MKIKKLKMRNFAQFQDFEIQYNGSVTKLVGVNGSGKTTVGLTGIWACLKGIAQKTKEGQLLGDRYRFIGSSSPTADIELTLIDHLSNSEIKVKNHISKQSNSISFEAPAGYPISNQWLSKLLHTAFISPSNFTRLDSKQQALELGIDTSEFDQKLQMLQQEYSYINKSYRAMGEVEPLEPCEKVDIHALYAEKEQINSWNMQQLRAMELRTKLKEEISTLKETIAQKEAKLQNLPVAKAQKAFDEGKIQQAEAINQKAEQYQNYLTQKAQREKLRLDLANNRSEKRQLGQSRIDYIRSLNFDFEGLSIDPQGKLLLSGRPIKEPYFSKGELTKIVAMLYTGLSPELKYVFLDDFEVFDLENQQQIIDYLLSLDFQIVTAEIGKEKEQENTVLLRSCRKVESYENQQPKTKLL